MMSGWIATVTNIGNGAAHILLKSCIDTDTCILLALGLVISHHSSHWFRVLAILLFLGSTS